VNARSGISYQAATNPGRGVAEQEIHLRNGSKLFKQAEPSLLACFAGLKFRLGSGEQVA